MKMKMEMLAFKSSDDLVVYVLNGNVQLIAELDEISSVEMGMVASNMTIHYVGEGLAFPVGHLEQSVMGVLANTITSMKADVLVPPMSIAASITRQIRSNLLAEIKAAGGYIEWNSTVGHIGSKAIEDSYNVFNFDVDEFTQFLESTIQEASKM